MKIAILTTDTTHHKYYIQCLEQIADDIVVFCEMKSHSFSFETNHKYESDQNSFELNHWFGGKVDEISNYAKTIKIESINNKSVINQIQDEKIDVVFVFGTGKIGKQVIDVLPKHTFNLHGGDPERYRGLDTHLWAIYHSDFTSLVTTLHKLDSELDTGDIVYKTNIDIPKNLPLYKLRALNTEICVRLSEKAIHSINKYNEVTASKQRERGRYYSAMPVQLKDICKSRFEKFTAAI